jgi:hypothetical protein
MAANMRRRWDFEWRQQQFYGGGGFLDSGGREVFVLDSNGGVGFLS